MEGVRPAARGDRDGLAALWSGLLAHHAAAHPAFALRREPAGDLGRALSAQLGDPAVVLLVWERDGEMLGFVAGRVREAPEPLDEVARAEIAELFVRPEARRRGIGRALAEAAAGALRGRGAARLEVRVAAANTVGQAFWRSLGFRDFVDVLHRPL